MRRPTFARWIRREALRLADARNFNLHALVAQAQRGDARDARMLAAALLLYAHENGCVDRLVSFVWDDDLRTEYEQTERKLGDRSAEKLALRGTPMMSLPQPYRDVLAAFDEAYHGPERMANEKELIWQKTHEAQLRLAMQPTAIARDLDLDPSNLAAYLKGGNCDRVTMQTAQRILAYLETKIA